MSSLVKISDLAEVFAGGGAPQDANDFSKDGIPFLRAGSLPKLLSGVKENELEKITIEVAKKHRLQLHSKGSIVFAKSGMSATKGNIYTLRNDCYVVNHLAVVRPNANCDSKYLEFTLRQYSPTSLILDAAYPSIRLSDICDFKIPLPPLGEQKRIAAILDKAAQIKAKREQVITKLDELAQSTFVEMFGDPLNSNNFEFEKLQNLTEFENGDRSSNYPSGDDIKESGVLFLSTKNIRKNQLDLGNAQYITEDKYDSLTRGKARHGDLIITLRGTLGNCCIFNVKNGRAFINAQMMIIRPQPKINSQYLHGLITHQSFQDLLQRVGNGAAVPQLTAAQLKNISIPVPNVNQQIAYAQAMDAIARTKNKLNVANIHLDKLNKSLQHQAFTTGFAA